MSEGLDSNNLPPGTASHGWLAIGGERVEGGWRYPERNAQGERIGTLTRWDAPAEGCPRYTAAKGGKRGLIFPADGLPAYAGTRPRDPMRHSDPSLTANVYTDPKLLDVAGAVASLPDLPLGKIERTATAMAAR